MSKRVKVVTNLSDAVERAGVTSHVERCVHTRHRLASCTKCLQACPVEAINLDDGIAVDTERCTGCGVCTTVCPTGAFEAVSPTISELNEFIRAIAAHSTSIGFYCENYNVIEKNQQNAIKLPCLGRIDESILLEAAAVGIQTVHLFNNDCLNCERKRGSDVAICAGQQVNALLQALQCKKQIAIIPHLETSGGTLRAFQKTSKETTPSRRAFFASLWESAQEVKQQFGSPQATNQAQTQTIRHRASLEQEDKYIPSRWKLVFAALSRLQMTPVANFSGDTWTDIFLNGRCSGCDVCTNACPTGALHLIESESKKALSFTSVNCVGCGLCTDVCCWNSLQMAQQKDLTTIFNSSSKTLCLHEQDESEQLNAPIKIKFKKIFEQNFF